MLNRCRVPTEGIRPTVQPTTRGDPVLFYSPLVDLTRGSDYPAPVGRQLDSELSEFSCVHTNYSVFLDLAQLMLPRVDERARGDEGSLDKRAAMPRGDTSSSCSQRQCQKTLEFRNGVSTKTYLLRTSTVSAEKQHKARPSLTSQFNTLTEHRVEETQRPIRLFPLADTRDSPVHFPRPNDANALPTMFRMPRRQGRHRQSKIQPDCALQVSQQR